MALFFEKKKNILNQRALQHEGNCNMSEIGLFSHFWLGKG